MKIVVISDSHGNIANIKYILGFAKKVKIDAIIHCGDWDNINIVNEVLMSGIPLYTVLGNADIDPEIPKTLKLKAKGFDENLLNISLGGRKVGIVHRIGDIEINKQDTIFHGHRHSKEEKMKGDVKLVRPGPLCLIESSFAVYDTDANRVEFFDL